MEELIQFSEMVAQPMTWFTLLLACIFLFLMGCDGGLQIRGELRLDRPETIDVFCYFSVGTVRAYSLKQSRQVIGSTLSFPEPRAENMCYIADTQRGGKTALLNMLPMGGRTGVSGNLTTGVTFTFFAATCMDAGIYRCELGFQSVVMYRLVDNFSVETKRLELYPNRVSIGAKPEKIDFTALPSSSIILKLTCSVYTTVQVTWEWQYNRNRGQREVWGTFEKLVGDEVQPAPYQRCRQPITNTMYLNISAEDYDTLYRCAVHFPGGNTIRSYVIDVTENKSDQRNKKDDFIGRVLSNAGWITVSLIIFFIFVLLAHTVATHSDACITWIRMHVDRGFHPSRWRHSRRSNARRNANQPVEVHEAGGEPAGDQDTSTHRPPNRRRGRQPASSSIPGEELAPNRNQDLLEGSGVDQSKSVDAFLCLDSPGAEMTFGSVSMNRFRLDLDDTVQSNGDDEDYKQDIMNEEKAPAPSLQLPDQDSLHIHLVTPSESSPSVVAGEGTSDMATTSATPRERLSKPVSKQSSESSNRTTSTATGFRFTDTHMSNVVAMDTAVENSEEVSTSRLNGLNETSTS